MATLKQVRDGLYDALSVIDGLRAYESQVNTPCAIVLLDDEGIDYHETMGGSPGWNMLVRVYVSSAANRVAQDATDDYLAPDGPRSIRQTLEDNPTLDGIVSDVTVHQGRERFFQHDQAAVYLGAEFTVQIVD